MAVTLHPPGNPKRFRITRTWKGVENQKFVSFGKDKRKARRLADELDESLAQRQRAYQLRREIEGLNVLRPDGGIIGLQHHRIQRSDRKPFERFHCRIEKGGKVTFKDFVINATRPFDDAFRLAVEFIAEMRGVEKNSGLFQRMLDTMPHYEKVDAASTGRKKLPQSSEEEELYFLLSQEAASFEQKRKRRVISGK